MNLYLIFREENIDYDEYDSAVVCAKSSKDAAKIQPGGASYDGWESETSHSGSWCSCPSNVKVTYLGKAASKMKRGVICASFNAG